MNMHTFKTLTTIFALCSLALTACVAEQPEDPGTQDSPKLVNMEVNVGISGVSDSFRKSRSRVYEEQPEDSQAATEDEMMQTLRIVIVRVNADGTLGNVEHNWSKTISPCVKYYRTFKVIGKEKKKIYLFVNENTTRTGTNNTENKVVAYNFKKIKVGEPFPESDINDLKITLNENGEELTGALPMSECFPNSTSSPTNEISVGTEDMTLDLFVTRAATKFTYLITNNTGSEYTLKELTISQMSNIEYYMPKDVVYAKNDPNKDWEIQTYNVPNQGTNNYYTFKKAVDKLLTVQNQVKIDPFYLLEGKYTDNNPNKPEEDKDKNYKTSITLEDANGKQTTLSAYFPNLSQLPRNTHVIVDITIQGQEIECVVDLRSYASIPLDPGFGM